MYCVSCGAENPDSNKYCFQCGSSLSTAGGLAPPVTVVPPAPARNSAVWIWVAGGVVLAALLVAALLIALPRVISGGEEVILALPNRDGEADLFLIRLGKDIEKGVEIAEDALPTDTSGIYIRDDDSSFQRLGQYGGFVPGSDNALVIYQRDEEAVIAQIGAGDKEAVELFSTDALPLVAAVLDQSGQVFIRESRDQQDRCYIASVKEDATRVAKGDRCWLTGDDEALYVYERDEERDEVTLTVLGLDGELERTLLNDREDVGSYRMSDDGSSAVLVETSGDGQRLLLVEGDDGGEVEISDEFFNISSYQFVRDSDLVYYVAENDEALLELHTSDRSDPLGTGLRLGATPSDDGKHLIYSQTDEDSETVIFSQAVRSSDPGISLIAAQNLAFSVLSEPDRIVMMEQDRDEVVIHTAATDGSDLVKVFDDDRISQVTIWVWPGEPMLFLDVRDQEGRRGLFVTQIDKPEGFWLLEDWYELTLATSSGSMKELVFVGREDPGDDPVLFVIPLEEGASPVELDDDAEAFSEVIFSANEKALIYNARTGDRADDVEVRRVEISAKERYEVLYEDAMILAARWKRLEAFTRVGWNYAPTTTGFCPGAPALVRNEARRTELDEDGQSCYRFSAMAGDLVTFEAVTADEVRYDLEMTLLDRSGNTIIRSTEGPRGRDPRITTEFSRAGLYYVSVRGQGYGEDSSFSLTAEDGYGRPVAPYTDLLAPGSAVRGSITGVTTYSSRTYGQQADRQTYSQAADFYYFEAEAGNRVIVDLLAGSLGSQLRPELYLMDSNQRTLERDLDSRDAHITYSIDQTGLYYIYIQDDYERFGDPDEYWYELRLTVQ